MSYLDLHCHVLPGIDDGAVDLDETVTMLRQAWEGGTRTVVATPHLYSPYFDGVSASSIWQRHATTIEALEDLRSRPDHEFLAEVELLLGAENHLTPELLKDAEAGEALTLAATRHLLVEPSPYASEAVLEAALGGLLAAGYWPVLAHVERYEQFERRSSSLVRLLERGCIAQLNAASVLGLEGREVRKASFELLSRGLIAIVASDGHGVEHRKPDLSRAAELLTREFGVAAVRSWFEEKPAEILGRTTTGAKIGEAEG